MKSDIQPTRRELITSGLALGAASLVAPSELAAAPSNFSVTLHSATLRHVVRRIDAIAMPTVAPPPAPTGTRDVELNRPSDIPGDFATIRNFRLNGTAGQVAVPPGTYGTFTANGTNGFTLGVAGATVPAVYNLKAFRLIRAAGPRAGGRGDGARLPGSGLVLGSPRPLSRRILQHA